MNPQSLPVLCLLLFADGATFSFFTTPLLLNYGRYHAHPAWIVALAGGAASAVGSVVQFLLLRAALASERPWMRRLAPSREKLVEATQRFPSASFLALLLARATPLPDAPLKLAAAAAGYSPVRYGIAILLGALPYYFALTLVGSRVRIPVWILVAASVAIVLGALVDRWRRARRVAS